MVRAAQADVDAGLRGAGPAGRLDSVPLGQLPPPAGRLDAGAAFVVAADARS